MSIRSVRPSPSPSLGWEGVLGPSLEPDREGDRNRDPPGSKVTEPTMVLGWDPVGDPSPDRETWQVEVVWTCASVYSDKN